MFEKPAFLEKGLNHKAEKAPCGNLHPLGAMDRNLERVAVLVHKILQKDSLAHLEVECPEIVKNREFILRLGHDFHCVPTDQVEADAGLLVVDQLPVAPGFALFLALDKFPGEQLAPVDQGEKIIPHRIKQIECLIGSRPCFDPVTQVRAETVDSGDMHISGTDIADSPVHREIQLLADPVRNPGDRVRLLGVALDWEDNWKKKKEEQFRHF